MAVRRYRNCDKAQSGVHGHMQLCHVRYVKCVVLVVEQTLVDTLVRLLVKASKGKESLEVEAGPERGILLSGLIQYNRVN